ncbi:D-2-hydroxyacid dehydrogenase [Peribacillus muralis]|uniref:D-2-hydroxyacid dehydrogenase n=1 Tax=Peribacillus muralis TaxID=264697 RepID=UPI001F4E19FF|nr:D-2-hydroxyacid dehydrogenase [Peribacillus muralis]MCK1995033.1 D-2-hydroxyacid dehydrogenase [Peribacillus muralis]MCK2015596.1 D-2-hydroxyacid dehydrogenase [Peribacillus muralis]
MNIENILITGHIYKEMESILTSKNLSKQFRFLKEDVVSHDDFLWADAYVSLSPTANFEFGNVKWVHSTGAGVDKYLFERKWDERVVLTRTIGSFGQRIGEYCLSYILKDVQMHDEFAQLKRKKQWRQAEPRLLNTLHVVIYGTGEIGQEIARILSSFGIRVSGVSRNGKVAKHFEDVLKSEDAPDLLMDADWIISTLPLTKQTSKLFNGDFFNQLNGSGFMNIGRGGTVDEMALREALLMNRVRKAILDVVGVEPLPETSWLWEHPDIFITPHISAITSPEEGVECFLQTLSKIEQDEPLDNQVQINNGY